MDALPAPAVPPATATLTPTPPPGADPAAALSIPLPDRAACERLAAQWGFVVPTGVELTDEARRRFQEASAPSLALGGRFKLQTWLSSNGFLADLPPDPAKTGPEDPTPASAIPAPLTPPDEPPAHPGLENAVLGCLVVFPETIRSAREALNPNDFSSAERMSLFKTICRLDDRGETVTPLILEAEYSATHRSGLLARDLVDHATSHPARPDALPKYIEFLKDFAARRANFLAARELLAEAVKGRSVKDSLRKARAILDRVDDETGGNDEPSPVPYKWPDPIGEAAYHGVAGDIVRLIAPRTEADPVAILAQLLVCFGNVIGRRAHWSVDASRHYCNEFVVVCGLTSRGRKGTSWDITRMLFDEVDPKWTETCFHSGVASGEGLIKTVRDAVYEQMKVGSEMMTTLVDGGVDDKRALWIEEEFQGVLSVMKREGSTLSASLRKAWQGSALENANKQSPMRATGAHISMIAHITFDELERSLGGVEISNGFANRYLWVCSRRSKLLPRGGSLFQPEFLRQLKPLADRLAAAVKFSGDDLFEDIEVGMSDEAWALYEPMYEHLSRPRVKPIGQVTDRAEAHVRRLSVVYALLDCKPVVGVEHLRAALAVWEYCERSVEFIFRGKESDPVAEEILAALTAAGDEGLSQNHINRKLFKGKKGEAVAKALGSLAESSLIRLEERKTAGRPAKVWVIWK